MSDNGASSERAYRKRFYKVGEVSELVGVEPHVLRYWESEFPDLQPRKSRGGQRLYTPADIELILKIRDLVHEMGFTIAGARRRLRARQAGAGEDDAGLVETLEEVRREIGAILTFMDDNDAA